MDKEKAINESNNLKMSNNQGVDLQRLVRCPWGMWNMKENKWEHNPELKMNEKEQFNDNVKNGYLCVCGKMPNMCNCI